MYKIKAAKALAAFELEGFLALFTYLELFYPFKYQGIIACSASTYVKG